MSGILKIVFMGADAIALPMLNALQRSDFARITAIFTQPDKAIGRGQKVRPNAIKEWALMQKIPVFQPALPDGEGYRQLIACEADLGLVMAYGHILKDDFIAVPRFGTLNLHTSLLPAYRGASPIQTAVSEGEKESGVSLMRIVRKLDAGPVADVERVCINVGETALDVEQKLAEACVPLVERSLPLLRSGGLRFIEQDESKASFCRKLSREDGMLDFSLPALRLASRINGLFPWPACTVMVRGIPIKIGMADTVELPAPDFAAPGTVLGSDKKGVLIATGECGKLLRLLRLQRPGGRMMDADEFLRGFPMESGLVLESHPMTKLVSSTPFRKD